MIILSTPVVRTSTVRAIDLTCKCWLCKVYSIWIENDFEMFEEKKIFLWNSDFCGCINFLYNGAIIEMLDS